MIGIRNERMTIASLSIETETEKQTTRIGCYPGLGLSSLVTGFAWILAVAAAGHVVWRTNDVCCSCDGQRIVIDWSSGDEYRVYYYSCCYDS